MAPDTSNPRANAFSREPTGLGADAARIHLTPREQLRDFMGEAGLRQADVASEIGCSQAYVSMLLNRKTDVSVNTARALERLTGGLIPASDWATSS